MEYDVFGLEVGVWVIPVVFEGSHGLAGSHYSVVDVVVVCEIEGDEGSEVFKMCGEINV